MPLTHRPRARVRPTETEARLRASEESYRTIFELASDAIFVHDVESGAILDANRKACEMHGCTLDELKALGVGGISDGRPPYDAAHAQAYVARAVAGEPQRFEWLVRRTTGERFWVEVSLHRVPILGADRVLAAVRNVDERKRAEAALHDAHVVLEARVAERTAALAERTAELAARTAELEAIFRALPDLYFRMAPDGTVHDYRAGRQFGLYVPPDEFLGRRVGAVMPPSVGATIEAALRSVEATGEPVDVEYTLPLGEERRDFEARLLPLDGDRGREVVAVVRDVTAEVRRAEELEAARHDAEAALDDLHRAQAQLVQQEKLAGLGRVTAGIAHELKNPLNFVTNFAALSVDLAAELRSVLAADPARPVGEVLGEAADLLDDLAGNAQKVADHGRRADGIVRAMMAHARGPAAARGRVDVNAVVAEHVALAADGWRSRTGAALPALTLDLDDDAATVDGVAPDLGRVVVNLVTNALDAVADRPVAHVAVRTRRRGRAVEVAVEDSGPGVAEAERARVFEPFFTTKPAGQGNVGLGLSLARDVVEDGHGGRLEVGEREGGGAVFTVHLPARPAPAA